MGRDNIAGIQSSGLKAFFLIPGKIIQWFMYIFVGNLPGYGKVREQTRKARSPFLTYVYSVGVWFFILFFIVSVFLGSE